MNKRENMPTQEEINEIAKMASTIEVSEAMIGVVQGMKAGYFLRKLEEEKMKAKEKEA